MRLGEACLTGACNPIALTLKLADCVKESRENTRTAAFKIVLGQISFLLGESIGPSMDAFDQYDKERSVYFSDFAPSVAP